MKKMNALISKMVVREIWIGDGNECVIHSFNFFVMEILHFVLFVGVLTSIGLVLLGFGLLNWVVFNCFLRYLGLKIR